ncbi:MAG: hypothetical protein SGI92_07210 [Bryobacteraceae bacterium]|nr:hypothetical protein [Bryobacteraceae bacterium]
MLRLLLLVVLLPADAGAQRFYVGVKGGTPLSDSRLETEHFGRGGGGPYRLDVRRYTFGPTVEVRLPLLGIGVVVDALYKRAEAEDHQFLGASFGTIDRRYWNSWEFPMLLRRGWRVGRGEPFGSAGGTFRVVPGFDAVSENFNGFPNLPQGVRTTYSGSDYSLVQGGWVAGGGVRFGLYRALKVTPELRYTRFTSGRMLPTQNQVEFLLGFGFGSAR